MDRKDLLNQYTWIMKVLDSCTNESQVETTQKLYDLYVKRWNYDLTDKQISALTSNFDKERKGKLYRVRKSTGSFLSKVSQFFLF